MAWGRARGGAARAQARRGKGRAHAAVADGAHDPAGDDAQGDGVRGIAHRRALAQGAGQDADCGRAQGGVLGLRLMTADQADQQGEEEQLQRAGKLRAHVSRLGFERQEQGSQDAGQGLCGRVCHSLSVYYTDCGDGKEILPCGAGD